MNFPETIHMAVLGAVLKEVEPLFALLKDSVRFQLHGEALLVGIYGSKVLLVGTTGLGKVNAAVTAAVLLERFAISEVWNIGCSGAYRAGPLAVGDVLISLSAFCGDEGVLTTAGAASTRTIGIPVLARDGREYYEGFPLDHNPVMDRIRKEIPSGCHRGDDLASPDFLSLFPESSGSPEEVAGVSSPFQLFYGPSLTVSMASGDAEVADERFNRYGAYAENMEGSAVAQTCFRFDVPMVECRGMSNIAGDRCKKHWRLESAVAHCHAVLLRRLDMSESI